jgi:hypothetical protein
MRDHAAAPRALSARRDHDPALINAGQHDEVRRTRQAFQDAMGVPFTAAVEGATGRRVIAFLAQVYFDPDLAAETFVLDPADAGLRGSRP